MDWRQRAVMDLLRQVDTTRGGRMVALLVAAVLILAVYALAFGASLYLPIELE